MEKEILNFRDFLTTLTSVPIKIKNKELAEIFQVSDGVISKIRHGKMVSIPINMRPLSNADRFASLIVERFAATASTVETFVIYATQILNEYNVSENLKKKIEAITWFDATKENHMEHVESMYYNEIPAFLSSCYSEAYYNTSALSKGENGRMKHSGSLGEGKSESPSAQPEKELSHDQLKEQFWKIGNRLFGGDKIETAENEALLPIFYGLIFQEAQRPYFDFSRRRELLTLHEVERGTVEVKRQVDMLEQLVLPKGEPIPFIFQERLRARPEQNDEELIRSTIQHFVCRVNDVPIQEYVFEHERIHAADIYDLFRVNRVEGTERNEPYILLELPFYLYPQDNNNQIRLEARYQFQTVTDSFAKLRSHYKLRRACRFLEHEFIIEEESAKRFGINLDIFAPFLYDTSAQFESPMSEKRSYINGSKDPSHGRVTFYDWALPGSGYGVNLYQIDQPEGKTR